MYYMWLITLAVFGFVDCVHFGNFVVLLLPFVGVFKGQKLMYHAYYMCGVLHSASNTQCTLHHYHNQFRSSLEACVPSVFVAGSIRLHIIPNSKWYDIICTVYHSQTYTYMHQITLLVEFA